jgi:D-alanine--poly(phosphoribitol) ligase subunit 2
MLQPSDVYDVIAEVRDSDQVRRDPDMRWFELRLLDSLGTVELIVALEEAFNISISPADIDAQLWATPRLVADFVLARVASAGR